MKRLLQIIIFTIPFLLSICCSSDEESRTSSLGKHKGHEYVDLGLPSGTKWATSNVGASSPYSEGYYVACGATISSDEDEMFINGFDSNPAKTTDKEMTLEPKNDIAHIKWGGSWRMPTKDEVKELIDECYWSWDSKKRGYWVRGRNGNAIFLYAAGKAMLKSYSKNLRIYDGEESLYYWTSTLEKYGCNYSYSLRADSDDYELSDDSHSDLLQVRAVLPKK